MFCPNPVARSYYATFVMNPRPWACIALLLGLACGSSSRAGTSGGDVTAIRHVDRAAGGSAWVPLAGARCRGRTGACSCRTGADDDVESDPPAQGRKRFELRLAADGGVATLESATLGRF